MELSLSILQSWQLVFWLVIGICLWKSLSTAIMYNITKARRLPLDRFDQFHDQLDMIKPKWALVALFFVIASIFNPIDVGISEQAKRTNATYRQQGAVARKEIPDKVIVEPRTLDNAIEKFDNAVQEQALKNSQTQ